MKKIKHLIVIFIFIFLLSFTNAYPEIIEGIAIKVNEDIITLSEFNAMWVPYVQSNVQNKEAQKKQLIKLLVQWTVFEQMAYEKGISITMDEVERALEERFAQKGIQGWDQFMVEMNKQGILSKELALRQHKLALLSQQFVAYLRYNMDPEFRIKNVSDRDIEKYYEKNLKKIVSQERRRIRHIVVIKQPNDSYETLQKKKELITGISRKAKSKVESFTDMVIKYSEDDTSKQRAGLVGEFTKGTLKKYQKKIGADITDLIFSMEEGEISDLVDSKIGFHVFQLVKIIRPEDRDMEEIREEIKLKIEERRYFLKMQEILEKKIKNSRVVVIID